MDDFEFTLCEAAHKKRGYAPVGLLVFKDKKVNHERNVTLNWLLDLYGTIYSDFVLGPSNIAIVFSETLIFDQII